MRRRTGSGVRARFAVLPSVVAAFLLAAIGLATVGAAAAFAFFSADLPSAEAVHVKGAATRQETRRMLFQFHKAMWTFHHKHYAEGLPAFANGLVWLATWLRWAVLAVKATVSRDPRVSP